MKKMDQTTTAGQAMAKKAVLSSALLVLASMLPMFLAVFIPALAHAQTIEGDPTDASPNPSWDTAVTVTFQLTVEGEPPEDATFFGYLGYEPAPLRLTDPDGDGVYTGSTPRSLVPAGDTQPALIVQGTGTRESQVVGPSPGEPIHVLKNFGEVTFEEDTTLPAVASFESSGDPAALNSPATPPAEYETPSRPTGNTTPAVRGEGTLCWSAEVS